MTAVARRWRASSILAAALWLPAAAGGLAGQEVAAGEGEAAPVVRFRLEPPAPSPFQDSLTIPFVLGEGPDPRRRASITRPSSEETAPPDRAAPPDSATVSIRIYNLLHQNIAWARAGPSDPRAGRPVREMSFAVPGRYAAVWDGTAADGYGVVSGPYFVELVVNGWTAVRKVLFTR